MGLARRVERKPNSSYELYVDLSAFLVVAIYTAILL